MAVITNLDLNQIVPSDVFGWEVNTDVGYGRENVNLTLASGKVARVGTVVVVDYVAKTARLATATDVVDLATAEALDLAVFVGKDLPTNGTNFDRLSATAAEQEGTPFVTVITRGDGRGVLRKGYLDFDGTAYYDLGAAAQKAVEAVFTTKNRFKVLEQQKPDLT